MRQMPQLLGHLALSSLKVWKLKQPVNIDATFSAGVDSILREFLLVGTSNSSTLLTA